MTTNGSASTKRGKSEDEYNYQGKAGFPTRLFSILWMTCACVWWLTKNLGSRTSYWRSQGEFEAHVVIAMSALQMKMGDSQQMYQNPSKRESNHRNHHLPICISAGQVHGQLKQDGVISLPSIMGREEIVFMAPLYI